MFFVRATLLMILTLTCVSLGYAQRYCTVPQSPYKHSALVVSRFDQSAGKMKTVLEYPPLDVKRGDRFTLYAFFFHHDLRLHETPTLDVTFVFASQQSSAAHSHDLSIFINGKPWGYVGPVQYVGKKEPHGFFLEAARMTLSYESLLQIISGRRVEARLGVTVYPLTEDHLEALREIASQLAPYAQWEQHNPTALSSWSVR